MKLYDTLSKGEKEVVPSEENTVRLYTCGPTVYNYAHIGNFRSYLFADSVARALRFVGHNVDWVMNITDVDDKTIRDTLKEYGPEATPEHLRQFTDKYLNIFLSELELLNVDTKPIRIIRVADVIPQIQEFIIDLIKKGYAYQTDDGVFFSIEKYQTDFGDYGQLVGTGFLEGKKVGARVKVDEYEKDNLSDFALWKKHTSEDGNIFWDHPTLGKGRPGWHIECSVINNIAFGGKPTDIHTGGVDLLFPHHTNEIAQSQPFYKPFAHHWAHCEHLQIEGKKMAKRDGNVYTLKDIAEKTTNPLAYRYLTLQTDFRKPMNFTWDSLDAASTALDRLYNSAHSSLPSLGEGGPASGTNEGSEHAHREQFTEALADNLNLPKALSTVWELLSDATVDASSKKSLLYKMDDVLGLGIANHKPLELEIPDEIQILLTQREQARASKDFALSDQLRTQIEAAGFELLDTKDGQIIKLK